MTNVIFLALGVLLAFMTTVFALALWVKDNSIVDIAYGLAFVVLGWIEYWAFGNHHPRQLLALLLLTIWGLRLTSHIFVRKQNEEGEDFRYRQWREEWGDSFVWRSYLQVFLLQGAVVFVVALPVLLIINDPGQQLGWIDVCGILVWLFGFGFEAVGDWQKLQFKREPSNRERIMQHGLWRLCRHPNYFGEATLWWGMFLIALGAPLGTISIVSPLLIGFLLLKVSGIPMLEAKYAGNPEFEAYKRQTNAFFPWKPKQGENAHGG